MAYTALFVEIIIIGIQASTWIIIFLIAISDPEQVQKVFDASSDYSLIFATALVPWLYTIGIVVDRICDRLFWIIGGRLLRKRNLDTSGFKDIAVAVIEKSATSSYEIYKYYLSRLRIMRAAAVNIPLTLAITPFAFSPHLPVFVPVSVTVIIATIWSYVTLIDRYFDRTIRIHTNLTPQEISDDR